MNKSTNKSMKPNTIREKPTITNVRRTIVTFSRKPVSGLICNSSSLELKEKDPPRSSPSSNRISPSMVLSQGDLPVLTVEASKLQVSLVALVFSPSVIDGEHSLEQQDSASKEVSQGEREPDGYLKYCKGEGE